MIYSYRVVFETDAETGDVVVSLPGLHHLADSGQTVEEALDHLRTLATGFIEVLQEQGEVIPDSDPPGEGFFLCLEVAQAVAV